MERYTQDLSLLVKQIQLLEEQQHATELLQQSLQPESKSVQQVF